MHYIINIIGDTIEEYGKKYVQYSDSEDDFIMYQNK